MTGRDNIGTPEREGVDEADVRQALSQADFISTIDDLSSVDAGLNVVYTGEVTTTDDDSQSIFVKIRTFTKRDEFAGEPVALDRLDEISSVPTPSLLYNGVGDGAWRDWYVMSREPGVDAPGQLQTLSRAQQLEISERAGRMLGRLHENEASFAGELAGRDGSPITVEESTGWADILNERMKRIAGQASPRFADLHNDIYEFVDENMEAGEVTEGIRLLHLDYWWENLLIDPEAVEITAVIDWGRTVGGDPVVNLATAEFMMFENQQWSDSRIQRHRARFRDGYRSVRRPSVDSEMRWCLAELYARLRGLRGFPYWYRDHTEEQKERFEQWLRDDVTRLLSGEPVTPIP